MEAIEALRNIPDNSVGVIIINAVDENIIDDSKYSENLQNEIKRVLCNNGIVFGFNNSSVLSGFSNHGLLFGEDYEPYGNMGYLNIKDTS